MVCKPLKLFERLLRSHGFLRCHRSYLVNSLKIKEFVKGRNACVKMTNGEMIPVSRRRASELARLLRMISNNAVYPVKPTVL